MYAIAELIKNLYFCLYDNLSTAGIFFTKENSFETGTWLKTEEEKENFVGAKTGTETEFSFLTKPEMKRKPFFSLPYF